MHLGAGARSKTLIWIDTVVLLAHRPDEARSPAKRDDRSRSREREADRHARPRLEAANGAARRAESRFASSLAHLQTVALQQDDMWSLM